jgi:ABC-type transport system involved in multi-copper enzyme maturation permease subunit
MNTAGPSADPSADPSAVPSAGPSAAPSPSTPPAAPARAAGRSRLRAVDQTLAVAQAELRKGALSLRALPVFGLAALPILTSLALDLVAVLGAARGRPAVIGSQLQHYADAFGSFVLPICIFFGCTAIFMNLFRGELLDRCLHYYFLTPIRREKVLLGKYLAGVLSASALFGGATAVSYLLVYAPFGADRTIAALQAAGLGQLAAYLGLTWLAVLGYGAVFLLAGLLVRNPVIPGVLLFGWESINFLLPPVLKGISVIHYLKSLAPIPVSDGPFALPAEPAPVPVAVAGVLMLAAAALAVAAWQVRRMEVRYGAD